ALSGVTSLTLSGAVSGGTSFTGSGSVTSTATSAAFVANSATATALQATAAPAASASSSIIQLGAAIAGGAATGNYIGINAANAYTGNFLHFELNSLKRFSVDYTGNLKVYDTSGTKTVSLSHDGTNGIISSSSGELQLSGSGSNQFILGDTGTAVNLVFQEASTITTVGGKAVTFGTPASGDIFNLNQSGVTYNIGTLTAASAVTLDATASGTSTKTLVVNGPSGLSANLLELQVAGTAKLSVSASGAITVAGMTTTGSYTQSGTSANTLTGATTISAAGAVSASAFVLSGAAYTGGSGTTTTPLFLIQPSGTTSTIWSTSGTYQGINAVSGFTGDLFSFQLNGASRFLGTYKGEMKITNGTTDAVGLTITQAASATGNAILVSSSSAATLFSIDVTGKIASGESLPGVPIVGIDPSSGTAGDLTSTSSALKPYAGAGLTLNIAAGSAYTADAVSSQTKLARCNLSAPTTLALTDATTEYVYVTASGAASTTGVTCQFNKSTTLPAFSASKPVVVLAKTVTAGGSITSVADTRFFIGGVQNYVAMPASSTYEPGMIVKMDTGVDNGVLTSTTGSDAGVYGIVSIGATTAGAAGKIIVMTQGSAWGLSSTGTTRAACGGTTTTAGILANITSAVNACVGNVMTAAAGSTPSVLVNVSPN
ncbi:MAG TPA: hypothetical protein VLA04_06860, partial [Verrucomicrobiae bacterium]|nr:hypothetical protein [Verrucomicrobiae bacterium]